MLGDGLWDFDPRAGLRAVALPGPSWPEFSEWVYWHDGWSSVGERILADTRDRPLEIADLAHVRGHLWITLRVDSPYLNESLAAVFTTGPHGAPVLLPGDRPMLGEILRLNSGEQALRLFNGVDDLSLRSFSTHVLPRLSAREDVLQIYEARLDDHRELIAIVDQDALGPPLLQAVAEIDGSPARARQPAAAADAVARVILGSPLRAEAAPGTARSSGGTRPRPGLRGCASARA